MGRSRRPLALGPALAVALLLTGCVQSSRTGSDYRLKTAETASALGGIVATALLVVQQADDGRVTGPFLEQTLTEQVDDASGVLSGYAAVQPPDAASVALRTRTTALGRQVQDTLDALVTDVRRGRRGDLAGTAAPLLDLRRRLGELEPLGNGLP